MNYFSMLLVLGILFPKTKGANQGIVLIVIYVIYLYMLYLFMLLLFIYICSM